MEQYRSGLARHAPVTVGTAGHHGFGHAENAAHAPDLVERPDAGFGRRQVLLIVVCHNRVA